MIRRLGLWVSLNSAGWIGEGLEIEFDHVVSDLVSHCYQIKTVESEAQWSFLVIEHINELREWCALTP